MSSKKRVFSGIQPTGQLTLGNYLGAIKNWVKIQHEYSCLFCIADLHSLTSAIYPQELKKNIKHHLAVYLSCGLDPEKVIIFQQSKISAHSELAWILNCFTQVGWLNRMTQFKDKARNKKQLISLGLYSYPVLMAADILLYKTNIVPIGEDQKQHVELARDIALCFNKKINNKILVAPEVLIDTKAKRIMSLRNAQNKMSKSDPSDLSRINMSDSAELIKKKIRKAKTDTIEGISYDPNKRPEISNLIEIYASLTDQEIEEASNKFKDCKISDFKEALSDVIIDVICPINKKVLNILNQEQKLEDIIEDGAKKASYIAEKNLDNIKKAIGI